MSKILHAMEGLSSEKKFNKFQSSSVKTHLQVSNRTFKSDKGSLLVDKIRCVIILDRWSRHIIAIYLPTSKLPFAQWAVRMQKWYGSGHKPINSFRFSCCMRFIWNKSRETVKPLVKWRKNRKKQEINTVSFLQLQVYWLRIHCSPVILTTFISSM